MTAQAHSHISNITRVESLLNDPASDITLPELRDEMNELAKLRQNSRLAFCKRLAIAYMLLIGRRAGPDAPHDGGTPKFLDWCYKNLYTANGKRYSRGTIQNYLGVGFASNPEKYFEARNKVITTFNRKSSHDRKLGAAITAAVKSPAKVISITTLRQKHDLPTNVASEVNALMRAWEQASEQARRQFLRLVGP